MQQTLLALLALSSATLLMLGMRGDAQSHEQSQFRAEAELAAVALGDQTLDELALLPATHDDPAPAASPLTLATARSLDEADGLRQTVRVPMQTGTAAFDITIDVQAVTKQGQEFGSVSTETPFRSVRVKVSGPLRSQAALDRLYADL